jgi:hypothetical protein
MVAPIFSATPEEVTSIKASIAEGFREKFYAAMIEKRVKAGVGLMI